MSRVTRGWLVLGGAAVVLAGCGGGQQGAPETQATTDARNAASEPLRIRELHGSVIQMGSLRPGALGSVVPPLYGVRLRADICARTSAEADRLYPASFRIAHYARASRGNIKWGRSFRTVVNDLYWIVPLGEGHGVCGVVEFEDVIPPTNYAGVESALGFYPGRRGCYGVQLTINAIIESADRKITTPVSAHKRAVIRCGPVPPR